MSEGALVAPPLGDGLQLVTPHLRSVTQWASTAAPALTSFLMLAAWGWGGLMPPVSSPLATRRLSSLCRSRIAALAAALSSRKEVLAEHSAEGPWQGSRVTSILKVYYTAPPTGYWHIVWSVSMAQ